MINGKAPVLIPSYEEVKADTPEAKQKYAESYLIQEQNTDALNASTLIEKTAAR